MKTFYSLLVNNLVATVTNFTVWFAITFFVFLQTRSVLATGILSGLYSLFVAFTGFWFGSLVDHFSKKKLMVLSSLLSLAFYAVALVIFLSVPASTFTTLVSPFLWLFVLVVMAGVIVGNIRGITLPTLVTALVPSDRRDRANGLVGTITGVSFLVTSVISGLLIGFAGMYWVLVLSLVLTILSVIHLYYFISLPPISSDTVESSASTSRLDIRGTLSIINSISGLFPLILFTTFNNFLGGVFMALMDAYGLSLVSVQVWGIIWGVLSTGFIVGGLIIAKRGLGPNPLKSLFKANFAIWIVSSIFTLQPSIILLTVGMYIYLCVVPYIEAAEHTIIQKVVPLKRQGRVFGFAQSVETAASPITAFLVGPIAQFIFIPFMTTGAGVDLIGDWFGTGPQRGIALVFTLTGIIGLIITFIASRSSAARSLSSYYQNH